MPLTHGHINGQTKLSERRCLYGCKSVLCLCDWPHRRFIVQNESVGTILGASSWMKIIILRMEATILPWARSLFLHRATYESLLVTPYTRVYWFSSETRYWLKLTLSRKSYPSPFIATARSFEFMIFKGRERGTWCSSHSSWKYSSITYFAYILQREGHSVTHANSKGNDTPYAMSWQIISLYSPYFSRGL